MSQRFFCETPIQGGVAQLTGGEAHHFLHVMRGQTGTEIVLFDGSGYEFKARAVQCGRNTVDFQVIDSRQLDRESLRDVTLAVALPKGDRGRFLVEKLTELGVRRLVPLITEHGVAQPALSALERMRRTVVEASKQCGRNRLMEVTAPVGWRDFVSRPEEGDFQNGERMERLVAHPDTEQSPPSVAEISRLRLPSAERLLMAVGPEGGLTEEEISAAVANGWGTIGLGRRILRIETAAVTLAAWALLSGPAE